MIKASTFTTLVAGALMAVSAGAFAQQPSPHDRSMNGGYTAAEGNPTVMHDPNHNLPVYNPNADRRPRDRFGNIIRGNNCNDHWANCAYDPNAPVTQQSQLPR